MSDSESSASELSQGSVSGDEKVSGLPTPSPSKRQQKQRNFEQNREMIVQTAFDAYFTHAASRAQTSSNVFSSLIPPLSAEEYLEASSSFGSQMIKSEILTSESSRKSLFQRLLLELQEGFNVICYGYGSKRALLNEFAVDSCSKAGHVTVANAFQPQFGLKQLLSCIENVPGIDSLPLSSSSVESQSQRIYDFFAQPSQARHLYVIIHNIDSPSLRLPKAQSCVSLLALNPKIHIVASIDHINAPLLWSSAELSARKDTQEGAGVSGRGLAWLWHDMTTLTPYDVELSHADRSSISGAVGSTRKRDGATQNAAAMVSETAALHILASVTIKAKKLFTLMAEKQLEAIQAVNAGPGDDLQQYGIAYDTLYHSARNDFIATNDTALRALLGEFRDHALVLGAQQGSSGEVLWIPMRKERLAKVLATLPVAE
ncbi:origin recognition complex subunit 2 [Gymnopus androsaceus JB14]|uniref:Origin recognition complex subunit 2 n=1 Tax=Gymnopus androsaceus JB14 TaxID=1447944 RepID=A0A6A4IGU1_9AGAR|nr:origin recognition complex subunit 2 [Gymnopus androsaceus JB14]